MIFVDRSLRDFRRKYNNIIVAVYRYMDLIYSFYIYYLHQSEDL